MDFSEILQNINKLTEFLLIHLVNIKVVYDGIEAGVQVIQQSHHLQDEDRETHLNTGWQKQSIL